MIELVPVHFNLVDRGDISPFLLGDIKQAFFQARTYKSLGVIATDQNEAPLLTDPNATWVIAAPLPDGLRASMRFGFEDGQPQLRFATVLPRETRRTDENKAKVKAVTFTPEEDPKEEGEIPAIGTFISSIVEAILHAKPTDLLVSVYKRN
ncbi:MAG TPA: hypothetical protein VFQ63_00670 [Patescibacteria group bacterium]|nr:hypothetical protein [Patescibacteria group bacterium]